MKSLDEIINKSRDAREVRRALCVKMRLSEMARLFWFSVKWRKTNSDLVGYSGGCKANIAIYDYMQRCAYKMDTAMYYWHINKRIGKSILVLKKIWK